MSKLKNEEKEPVYTKLKGTIIKEIKNGTLKEDDIILSERLLGEKFAISRISVRKAISELVEESYLYTVPGKGTFVKGRKSESRTVQKKTFNLGYIFWGTEEEVTNNPYFAHFIQGAEKEAIKHNYHLLISSYKDIQKDGKTLIPSVITQGKVDGVLVEGIDIDSYKDLARLIPTVNISNYIRFPEQSDSIEDMDIVIANDQNACITALKYLYNLGHRKIGFIYENLNHSSFYNRYCGFNIGVAKFGLITKPEWIVGDRDPMKCAEAIFNCEEKPTAIVATNDWYALGAIEWCKKNNINVPDDISILGFDDIERSMWSVPALTTVRVMTDDMGRLAARRLIEKIEDPHVPSTHILVGTSLIIRDSCKENKE